MPELPEVETSRRGIEPWLLHQQVTGVIIRNPRMRWPVPSSLKNNLTGQFIRAVKRRGKYILIEVAGGHLILHLGMSGSLRITETATAFRKHDHFIIQIDNDKQLRLHDPRRFGAVLWQDGDVMQHPLLQSLGPEPLSDAFDTDYFYNSCNNRKTSIKQHIMNSHIVVGVGNIYASESLYSAGIHPRRPAGRIAKSRLAKLVTAIKEVLAAAIQQGGTTLRDFLQEDGQPGYFKLQLKVYDQTNKPCLCCGTPIKQITLGQRSTYYCPRCQT